jgi:hypothetical protein
VRATGIGASQLDLESQPVNFTFPPMISCQKGIQEPLNEGGFNTAPISTNNIAQPLYQPPNRAPASLYPALDSNYGNQRIY